MEHSKKLDLSISAADLERIERILDYHFSRPERVALALTHSSWANEHGLGQAHNERLEFLGDAVLELCISWELFTRFPQAREGDMTRVRSQLVGTTSLAQRARETGIDQLLRLGRGEEQQGGRSRDAVLSDVFEAVLASVYEDGGYAAAQKVVARIFGTLLDEVSVDAARWYFNAKPDTQMEFDLGLAVREDSENPIYYIQYAHARICSLLKALEEEGHSVKSGAVDLSILSSESERALIKELSSFAEEIRMAARDYDPSYINRYLMRLAAAFHKFYNACRIKGEDDAVIDARLKLAAATRQVLANGLQVIGCSAPEKM